LRAAALILTKVAVASTPDCGKFNNTTTIHSKGRQNYNNCRAFGGTRTLMAWTSGHEISIGLAFMALCHYLSLI